MAYLGKTPSQAVRSRYFYTATGGETSLSGADDNSDTLIFADGNYVDVYLNGVLLVAGSDYNVNTTNTISGLTALVASDIVEIVVYDTFAVFGGNFQGTLTANSINLDSTTTVSGILDEDTMASDSATSLATQQSIKAYVDTQVATVPTGDITEVTAGTGLTGGGTSGAVTVGIDSTVATLTDTQTLTNKTLGATAVTGDVTFGDNNSAVFGAGADLTINHDGSNSFITDSGDGALYIQGTSGVFIRSADGGENLASFTDDGAATLFHNNAAKLATTATGVDAINTAGSSTSRFGSTYNTGANDGTLVIGNGGSGKAMLRFDYEGTNTDRARIGVSSSGQQLEFYTAGDNERMRIDSSGFVGIGESSPQKMLHITKNDSDGIIILDANGTTTDHQICFTKNYGAGNTTGGNYWGIGVDGSENKLVFAYDPNAQASLSADAKVVLDSSGNVGIGTVSPTFLTGSGLEVSRSGTATVRVERTDATASAGEFFAGNDKVVLGTATNTHLQFRTNNVEAMRILSDGKVGIGTSSPAATLQVESSTNSPVLIKSTNASGGYIEYQLGNSAALIGYLGNSAALVANGTAGDFAIRAQNNFVISTNGTPERFRIDSSGNVTIQPAGTKTRSFGETVALKKDQSAPTRLSVRNDTNDSNSAAGVTVSAAGNSWTIECGSQVKNGNALTFALDATAATPAQKMHLSSSGKLTISSYGTGNHDKWDFNGGYYASSNVAAAGNSTRLSLQAAGTQIGAIYCSASSTSFLTSSDYRLKENVTADWDATTRLKQLNPVRFNFIADTDTTVDGFLAHEVQDIVPEAISGTKDAVDDDGNPEYQGIDQSKLVPLLVKTIQELEARIAALENV